MVWFALSFQDQVEKYGVYVGIASFFGLAVLTLLYFAQARELKRLREWAGRAPERAHELEQRVVAQATASVARRPGLLPGARGPMTPARRLAEMPAPAASPQATELVDAVPDAEQDAPATNGSVPHGPGGTIPAPPPAVVGVNGSTAPAPEQEAPEPEPDAAATEAGAAPDAPAVPDAAPEEEPAPTVAAAAPPPATPAGRPPAPPAADPPVPAAVHATGEDTAEHDIEEETDEPPLAAPQRTPAERVGVTPRPAPMPLRRSTPSATPGARRPGARAGAGAPSAPRREGRSAGTIALLAGVAVLLLGLTAFGLTAVLGGDGDDAAPNRPTPPAQTTEPGDAGADAGSAIPPEETTVGVLNGTTTNGLAGSLVDRIATEGGFNPGPTATNTRDQTLTASTVFYADGFRGQARDVARILAIDAVEPIDPDTQALAPDADVVVLAGADQAP